MRWLSPDVPLVTEPGGDVVVELTNDEPIAAVLDRRVVAGIEWIRVQVGRGYAQDFVVNGWAPYATDVRQGGRTLHIEPVYEPITPACPAGEPTVRDLDGMLPLLALHCFGSRTLTFSPVQVRDEGSEEAPLVDGSPAWLAEGGELAMYWFPDWREMGSIRLYVDPASAVAAHPVGIAERVWLEVSGQLDHPSARDCTRTSAHAEFQLANREEAVQICRSRFVLTGVRRLPQAEIPARPLQPTPGPLPETSVSVAVRTMRAPIPLRFEAASIWTGAEMIVWGGWEWNPDDVVGPRAGGVAYDPARSGWRRIARGPLAPRAGPVATWTGSEMLVWGGYDDNRSRFDDGAAYDPATDSWRMIAAGPLRWGAGAGSVWTGTEWWIAATSRNGRVSVAAYDPTTNSWREVPAPTPTADGGVALVWTGSEVLLMDSSSGLLRISPDGSEWTSESIDFGEPIVWTGKLLVSSRHGNLAQQPFDWKPWSYPVAWDPLTRESVELPLPPHDVGEPVWTGRYLAYFEDGLALDLEVGEWLRLVVDQHPQLVMSRTNPAKAWSGDRLIVWGGWWACPGYSSAWELGYELIPAWSTLDGLATWGRDERAGLPPGLRDAAGIGSTIHTAAC